jgi:hypothetical protein
MRLMQYFNKSLKMSAGRIFAASPKSTLHISPGCVLFIHRFHVVEQLETLQRPLVTLRQRHGLLPGLDDAAHDFPSCFVRQLRYFRDDFRCAHGRRIIRQQESVNILVVVQFEIRLAPATC